MIKLLGELMLHRLYSIPDGEGGTDVTVAKIIDGVQRSLRHPALRLLALKIINSAGVANRDARGAVEALYRWIVGNIRFIRDPLSVELVQSPAVTTKLRAGDCDDHAALFAALAAALGFPVRFRVIGENPDNFRHIYSEVLVGGDWLPADTTAKRQVGYAPPKLGVDKVYTLRKADSMAEVTALRQTKRTISRTELQKAVRAKVKQTLLDNWNAGLIDKQDVEGYLRVIDERNAPFSMTPWLSAPIREAIQDFRRYVIETNIPSLKPAGTVGGLEGLDGFLSSVWNAAKNVVKGAINLITGGGKQTVEIKTTPVQPSAPAAPPVTLTTATTKYVAPVPTVVPPMTEYAPMMAGKKPLTSEPLFWVAIGLGALLLLRPAGRAV